MRFGEECGTKPSGISPRPARRRPLVLPTSKRSPASSRRWRPSSAFPRAVRCSSGPSTCGSISGSRACRFGTTGGFWTICAQRERGRGASGDRGARGGVFFSPRMASFLAGGVAGASGAGSPRPQCPGAPPTPAPRGGELCRARALSALGAIPASILGPAYMSRGRPGEAIPLLERAIEIASVLGAPMLGFLGEAYLLSGRTDDAQGVATRALGLSVEREERGWEAWTLRLLGEVAARREGPQVEAAADAYRRAMRVAEELGMRPLIGRCHLGLGELYRCAGKRQPALEHLTAAATMFRELDMRSWLEKAETAMAQAC